MSLVGSCGQRASEDALSGASCCALPGNLRHGLNEEMQMRTAEDACKVISPISLRGISMLLRLKPRACACSILEGGIL